MIIEKVTGLVINDVNQALTRYRAGELDHLEPLPPGQYPALKEELPDEATSVPRLCSYYYAFNHTGSGTPPCTTCACGGRSASPSTATSSPTRC